MVLLPATTQQSLCHTPVTMAQLPTLCALMILFEKTDLNDSFINIMLQSKYVID